MKLRRWPLRVDTGLDWTIWGLGLVWDQGLTILLGPLVIEVWWARR